jgi:hypothetical protein
VRIVPPIVHGPPPISGDATGPDRLGLICGFLGCDVRPFNPLLAALPRTRGVSPWLWAIDGGWRCAEIDRTGIHWRARNGPCS